MQCGDELSFILESFGGGLQVCPDRKQPADAFGKRGIPLNMVKRFVVFSFLFQSFLRRMLPLVFRVLLLVLSVLDPGVVNFGSLTL